MPTSSMNQGPSKDGDRSKPQQTFNAPPSSRALALVSIAVFVGLLLVIIVNADNSANKNDKNAEASVTTTTAKSSETETTEKKSQDSETSTTKKVEGTKDPQEVSVLVLNGSSVAGVATTFTTAIADLDYKTLTPGDDASKDPGTYVYYKSGFKNDAEQLATNVVPGLLTKSKISQSVKTLQFPASAPVAWDQENLVAANVVIVVGNSA